MSSNSDNQAELGTEENPLTADDLPFVTQRDGAYYVAFDDNGKLITREMWLHKNLTIKGLL